MFVYFYNSPVPKAPLPEYTKDKPFAFARLQGSQYALALREWDTGIDFQNRKVTDAPSCPAFSPGSEDIERRKVPQRASGEREGSSVFRKPLHSLLGLLSVLLVCLAAVVTLSSCKVQRASHPPKMPKSVSLAALGTHVEMSPGNTCEIRVWYHIQDF